MANQQSRFCARMIQLEQDVTVYVANASTAANLKTGKLFKDQATRREIHGITRACAAATSFC